MKLINHIIALSLSSIIALPALHAEKGRDKELTYVMENPYDVEVIEAPKGKKIKNVILMIGDGMSLAHIYSAWTANRGKLWIENAQYTGLSKTYCLDKLITDSGAGGTALASGQKTKYHMVGTDGDGRPLKSLIEYAHDKNLASGVAVTCRLWDATPGDFCCHVVDRDNEDQVMADYVETKADVVIGAGWSKMIDRKDGRNLFDELKGKGFQIARSLDELDKIKKGKVFCVTDSFDTKLPAERGDYLAHAALDAIRIMSKNPNGFFLMIEGSQLDDYGHFNDIDLLMQETHDFDRTVGEIFKWAAKDGETLVVVTADHETGGLTLVDGDLNEGRIVCKFSTGGHSGVMVPIYAFGPGSENFTGIMENCDIANRIIDLLNLRD
ncbi:MAG: alkaline phosphatase [Clostridiales bacterium]|nr:alkaline phosphatase [Clostridiales bacterium]